MPTTRSQTHQRTDDSGLVGVKRDRKNTVEEFDEPETKSTKHEPNQKAGRRNSKNKSKKATTDEVKAEDKEKKAYALEKGHIYFFYRPKVDVGDDVESANDVQKLYMVLKPHWTRTGKRMPTLVVLGRRKMPQVADHARYWGFVAAADDDISKLTEAFKESSYETKTRGTRTIHAARPVAEGVYMINTHNGHSHLAYITTAPREPGAVQEAFNIDKEASLIISIKNPEMSNPEGAGLRASQKAEYQQDLQECFRDRRFVAMETTQFLNYANCEILLIGASDNLIQELGEVGEELYDLEEEDEFKMQETGEEKYIFEELKLDRSKAPIEPLHGEWK